LTGSTATSIAPVVAFAPARTSCQLVPPLVVRYRPRAPPGTNRLPVAAAKIRLAFVGSIASRPIRSVPDKPACVQVAPPSVER
jgi:hypothetical protein